MKLQSWIYIRLWLCLFLTWIWKNTSGRGWSIFPARQIGSGPAGGRLFFSTASAFSTGPGWPRPFTVFHGLAGPDLSEKHLPIFCINFQAQRGGFRPTWHCIHLSSAAERRNAVRCGRHEVIRWVIAMWIIWRWNDEYVEPVEPVGLHALSDLVLYRQRAGVWHRNETKQENRGEGIL